MRRALLVALLIAGAVAVASNSLFLLNAYLLATGNGFFVPEESTMWTFQVIEFNSGSGDWWILAEDDERFFSVAGPNDWGYFMVLKSALPEGFDLHDISTWIGAKRGFSQQ